MSESSLAIITLTALGVLVLPSLALLINLTRSWTKLKDQLSYLIDRIDRLEATAQRLEDSTDRRVTYLEQQSPRQP